MDRVISPIVKHGRKLKATRNQLVSSLLGRVRPYEKVISPELGGKTKLKFENKESIKVVVIDIKKAHISAG